MIMATPISLPPINPRHVRKPNHFYYEPAIFAIAVCAMYTTHFVRNPHFHAPYTSSCFIDECFPLVLSADNRMRKIEVRGRHLSQVWIGSIVCTEIGGIFDNSTSFGPQAVPLEQIS